MSDFAFAVPGDIGQATGGYVYDRRLLSEWRAAGLSVPLVRLPDAFPAVDGAVLAAASAALADAPRRILVDGLAYGVLPPDWLRAEGQAKGREWVALVHHPLCLETGLSADQAARLAAAERAALAEAAQVICTSPATAAILTADFAVPPDRLLVAEPGVTRFPRLVESSPPLILAVGSLIARKGYEVLLAALAPLQDRPWSAVIVGGARDAVVATALRAQVAALGLSGRVTFAGEKTPDELAALYGAASLFVHTAHFEGFGMALADAIASGLPVVATAGGAVRQIVPPGAALLLEPGDAAGISAALAALLDDPARRRALGGQAQQLGRVFSRWDRTAAAIAAVMVGERVS